MEPIDLETKDPPSSLSGYANGEIMTLEISDVSPDLLVLEVKDNHLPESIHRDLDMETAADFHEDAHDDEDDDDGHGFANVELQFFPCDACEASFTSGPELEQHFISSHSICDLASERGRLKAKSVDIEGVTPLHTCTTCGKVFKYLTSFRKHEETHNVKPLYTCKTCGKEFKYLTSFTKHQETHMPDQEERPRGRTMRRSIKAVGLSVNQKMKGLHSCRHCGKEFKYATSFIKHEKTHRMTLTRKKQRNTTNSEMITGIRKEPTETHIQAFRKHSEDAEDQEASIVISSDDELATTAEQQKPDSKRSPPFPCQDCGKVFQFFKSYQKHLKRHAWAQGKSEGVLPNQKHKPEENIRCPVCGRAFNKQTTLTKHQTVYHLNNNSVLNANTLTCCECDRHFEKADIFQKHKCFHLRKHVKAYIEAGRVCQQWDVFHCQLCVLTLTSGMDFENHARVIHQDQYRKIVKAVGNVKKCIIKDTLRGLQTRRDDNQTTGLGGTKTNSKRVGERAGDTTKQFICKDCGECFMYHASFNFCGKCLKVRKNLKRYHCKECGQSFGRKDHLKRHSYSHSGSSFICSDCGIRFRDPGELRTHEKTHRVRNHVCQLCEKRFEQQEELMLHSEVAHPGPDGYTCHHCGKTFSKVKNLGKHRMIHSYKTPHVCSHCGKRFKRQEHLRRHESLHTNEKHHLCHCCGDAFVRKEDLNTHLSKKHTTLGRGNCLCKACGMTFKDRNSLRRHRYHSHTKTGKVYQCEECGLSFSRADHLKRHQNTHSSERPFSCSICYKVFHRADNLKKHERNHRNKWLEYLSTRRRSKTLKMEGRVSESSKWKLGRSEASALLKLIQSYSKQKHQTCYVCKKTFRGLYYLKRHRLLNCGGERNTMMDSFRYGKETVK
ncbi:zinc finger protein 709-like [Esox lucius]|uniref:zinc finger protein 709-like n=1 Tax=Esox lucius TaxID=8010 RepID=UPI0014769D1D|nr:zinc finger protein 709-like [Esox lucius]XP_019911443.2 zinc finger protein 709-like [Esox lucius]